MDEPIDASSTRRRAEGTRHCLGETAMGLLTAPPLGQKVATSELMTA
ncbi:hypothetical protein [Streptomyces sp. NPDC014676]